ncbi:MAG: DUF4913 domain-containing protein [Gordonia sp. (in: high G+C Gram-positive bacteria)]|uniref:DUF4913 domain-containing protein n=1 Tax=Gordonia sp. (in: high G+C Gram-positive bacteria) TaxID=84139 RepID=UPI003BB5EF48
MTSFDVEDDELIDDETDEPVEPRFDNVGQWVEEWFMHVVAGKYSARESPGQRTWCPQWWAHPAVVVPLSAAHQAWEEARASEDRAAMSAWWVHHGYPHIRWLTDSTAGPMYRCAKSGAHLIDGYSHSKDQPLDCIPAPAGWFDDPESQERVHG